MPGHPTKKRRLGRRYLLPLAWTASIGSIVVLGLALTGTLSGFTAAITNNANSAGTGSIIMEESSGGTNCFSTTGGTISTNINSTCAINKLGGNLTMIPGEESTVAVTITNTGTEPVATAFTLTPGGCSASANGSPSGSDTSGFCGKVDLAIWDSTDGTCIVPSSAGTVQANCVPSSSNTLTSLGTTPLSLTVPVAASGAKTFSIMTEIDPSATNADMALQVSDNLTWTFNA